MDDELARTDDAVIEGDGDEERDRLASDRRFKRSPASFGPSVFAVTSGTIHFSYTSFNPTLGTSSFPVNHCLCTT